MKRSKLLFLTPCVALTSIMPIVSCGGEQFAGEDIIDAIFAPHDLDPTTPADLPDDCTTYAECLLTLNTVDRQKELIYSLYAPIIYENMDESLGKDKSMYDLWKDNYFDISARIVNCYLSIKENQIFANFSGYVNFIFKKEWDEFKVNNFIQITFQFDSKQVTPTGGNFYLNYGNLPEHVCWGIIQAKQGDHTVLIYLDEVGSGYFTSWPKNWHNWGNK